MEVKGIGLTILILNPDEPDQSQKKLLFLLYTDTAKIAYLPKLEKAFTPDQIEKIGDLDLLLFPLSTDESLIHNTLEEINPQAFLPLINQDNQHLKEAFFTKLGVTAPEPQSKVVLSGKKDTSEEQLKIYLLS